MIAPPPLIFLGFLLLGWFLQKGLDLPRMEIAMAPRLGLGFGLVAIGLALDAWASEAFRRRGTAVQPWKPSTTVVDHGPYGFTRNPIYLGFALVFVGVAVLSRSWTMLALLVPCLILVDRGVIAREERYLSAKFGAGYDAYRTRVRRWL